MPVFPILPKPWSRDPLRPHFPCEYIIDFFMCCTQFCSLFVIRFILTKYWYKACHMQWCNLTYVCLSSVVTCCSYLSIYPICNLSTIVSRFRDLFNRIEFCLLIYLLHFFFIYFAILFCIEHFASVYSWKYIIGI